MLLSQLIVLPILVVFVWIYFYLRPHRHDRSVMVFDAAIVASAVGLSAFGLIWIDAMDIGGASPVWKPILSIITTFHIFPVILLVGWVLRRRFFK